MSFTFADFCHRCAADYALLQQRTDLCARVGRSYEIPCKLPAFCTPQQVMMCFYRYNDSYLLYVHPPVSCVHSSIPLFSPPLTFSSFEELIACLHKTKEQLYSRL